MIKSLKHIALLTITAWSGCALSQAQRPDRTAPTDAGENWKVLRQGHCVATIPADWRPSANGSNYANAPLARYPGLVRLGVSVFVLADNQVREEFNDPEHRHANDEPELIESTKSSLIVKDRIYNNKIDGVQYDQVDFDRAIKGYGGRACRIVIDSFMVPGRRAVEEVVPVMKILRSLHWAR